MTDSVIKVITTLCALSTVYACWLWHVMQVVKAV